MSIARTHLTASEVQERLQEFYDADRGTGRGRRISQVLLLGSGFETDVFAFTVDAEGGNGAEELILRPYSGQGAAEKAALEFEAMTRLREAGYPVPWVLALQRDPWPLGRPFA